MADDYLMRQAREKLRDTQTWASRAVRVRPRRPDLADKCEARLLLHAKVAATLLVAAMPEEE